MNNKYGKKPVKEYVRNIRQSLAYSAKKVMASQMPAFDRTIRTNTDIVKDVTDFFRKDNMSIKKATSMMKSQPEFKYTAEFLKNMKSDAMSGKLYNEERSQSNSEQMLKDMGFGMDDDIQITDFSNFDDITNDEGNEQQGGFGNALRNAMSVSEAGQESRTKALADSIANSSLSSAEYMGNVNQSIFSATLTAQTKFHSETMSALSNIQHIGSSILDFNNTVMVEHINNTNNYYDDSLNELRQIKEFMHESTEMQRNLYKGENLGMGKSSRVTIEDVVDPEGVVSIKDYMKSVKQNVINMASIGSRGDIQQLMAQAASSPWAFMSDMMVRGLLPVAMKKGMNELDKSVSGLFSAMILKINRMKKENAGKDNIFSFLGKILGIETASASKPDLSLFRRQGLTPDVQVRQAKAITEVIPAYLAKLVAIQTGEEMHYNYASGKFVNRSSARYEYDKKIKDMHMDEMKGTHTSMLRNLGSYNIKNGKEKESIEKDLVSFVSWLGKSGEFFDPKKDSYKSLTSKGLKLDKGEPMYKLLQAAFLEMSKGDQLRVSREQINARNTTRRKMKQLNEELQDTGMSTLYNEFDSDIEPRNNQKGKKSKGNKNEKVSQKTVNNIVQTEIMKGITPEANSFDVTGLDDITSKSLDTIRKQIRNTKEYRELEKDKRLQQDNKGFMNEFIGQKDIGKRFDYLKSKFTSMMKSPTDFIVGALDTIDKTIYKIVYGNDDEDGHQSIWGKVMENVNNMGKQALDFVDNKILLPMHDKLFGKEGLLNFDDHEFLKEFKGFLPKGVAGALVGAVGSAVLPGGPLLGAFLGAGISFANHSEKVKEYLFGKMDEDGKRDASGMVPPEYRDMIKKYAPKALSGAGVGIFTSMFMPYGPVFGAFMGAARSMLMESDKFKDWFWGGMDPETEKRKGGIAGSVKDFFNKELFEPFKGWLHKSKDNVRNWFKEAISGPMEAAKEPIRQAFEIIGNRFKDAMKDLKGIINDVFERNLGLPLKEFVKTKITDPMKNILNKVFSTLGKALGAILSAPVKALVGISKAVIEDEEQRKATKEKKEKGFFDRMHTFFEEFSNNRKDDAKNFSEKVKSKKDSVMDKMSSAMLRFNMLIHGGDPRKAEEMAQQSKGTLRKMVRDKAKTVTTTSESTVQPIIINQQPQQDTSKKESPLNTEEKKNPLPGKTTTIVKGDGTVETRKAESSSDPTKQAEIKGEHKKKDKESKTDLYLKKIESHTRLTLSEVSGQLNGVGYNIAYIKNILIDTFGTPSIMPTGLGGTRGNKKRKGIFSRIFDFVANPVKFIGNLMWGTAKNLGKSASKGIAGILKLPFKMISGVWDVAKGVGEFGLTAFKMIGTVANETAKTIGSTLRVMVKGIGGVIQGLGKAMGSMIAGLGSAVKDTTVALFKLGKDVIPAVVGGLVALGKTAFSMAFSVIKGIGNLAVAPFKLISKALGGRFESVLSKKVNKVYIEGGNIDTIKTVEKVKVVDRVIYVNGLGDGGPDRGPGGGLRTRINNSVKKFKGKLINTLHPDINANSFTDVTSENEVPPDDNGPDRGPGGGLRTRINNSVKKFKGKLINVSKSTRNTSSSTNVSHGGGEGGHSFDTVLGNQVPNINSLTGKLSPRNIINKSVAGNSVGDVLVKFSPWSRFGTRVSMFKDKIIPYMFKGTALTAFKKAIQETVKVPRLTKLQHNMKSISSPLDYNASVLELLYTQLEAILSLRPYVPGDPVKIPKIPAIPGFGFGGSGGGSSSGAPNIVRKLKDSLKDNDVSKDNIGRDSSSGSGGRRKVIYDDGSTSGTTPGYYKGSGFDYRVRENSDGGSGTGSKSKKGSLDKILKDKIKESANKDNIIRPDIDKWKKDSTDERAFDLDEKIQEQSKQKASGSDFTAGDEQKIMDKVKGKSKDVNSVKKESSLGSADDFDQEEYDRIQKIREQRKNGNVIKFDVLKNDKEPSFFEKLFSKIKTKPAELFDNIGNTFKDFNNMIKGQPSKIGKFFKGTASSTGKFLKGKAASIGNSIGSFIDSVLPNESDAISSDGTVDLGKLKKIKAFNESKSNFTDGIKTKVKGVKDKFGELKDEFFAKFDPEQGGKPLSAHISDGVIDYAKGFASSIFPNITKNITGEGITEGLAKGALKGFGKATLKDLVRMPLSIAGMSVGGSYAKYLTPKIASGLGNSSLMKLISPKLAETLAAKGAAGIGHDIPLVDLLFSGYDLGSGYFNSNNILQTNDTSTGMKLASGLASGISGLAFGIPNKKSMAQGIYKFFGGDTKDLQQRQADFQKGYAKYKKSHPNATIDDYNAEMNPTLWDKTKKFGSNVYNQFSSLDKNVGKWDETAGTSIKNHLKWAGDGFKSLDDKVGQWGNDAGTSIKNHIKWAGDGFKSLDDKVGQWGQQAGDYVKNNAKPAWDHIKNFAGDTLSFISNPVSFGIDHRKGITELDDKVGQWGQEAGTSIKNHLKWAGDGFKSLDDKVGQMGSSAGGWLKKLFSGNNNSTESDSNHGTRDKSNTRKNIGKFGPFNDKVGKWGQQASQAFNSVDQTVGQWGNDAGTSIKNHIKWAGDGFKSLDDKVGQMGADAGASIKNNAKWAWGKLNSADQAVGQWGQQAGASIKNNAEWAWDKIKNNVLDSTNANVARGEYIKSKFRPVGEAFSSLDKKVGQMGADAGASIKNNAIWAWGKVSDGVSEVANSPIGKYLIGTAQLATNPIGFMLDHQKDIEGAKKWVDNNASWVSKKVSDGVSQIANSPMGKLVSSGVKAITDPVGFMKDNPKLLSGAKSVVSKIADAGKNFIDNITGNNKAKAAELNPSKSDATPKKSMMSSIKEKVSSGFSAVKSAVTSVPKFAATAAKAVKSKAEDILEKIWGWISGTASKSWDWIKDKAGKLYDAVKPIGDWISKTATEGWTWIKDKAGKLYDAVKPIGDWISTTATEGWNWIKEKAGNIYDTLKPIGDWIAGTATEGWDWIKEKSATISTDVSSVWGWISSTATEGWDWIKDKAANISDDVKSVWGWISSTATEGWDWIKEKAGTISDDVKSVWDWISGTATESWDWIKDKAGAIADTMSSVWDWLSGTLGSAIDSVSSGIQSVVSGIENLAGSLGSSIMDGISNLHLSAPAPDSGIIPVTGDPMGGSSGRGSVSKVKINNNVSHVGRGDDSGDSGDSGTTTAIKQVYDWLNSNLSKLGSDSGNALSSLNDFINNRSLTDRVLGRGSDNNSSYTYYNQGDKKWGNMPFGKYDGHTDTLADGGCGPTVASMAISKLTGDKVTPDVTGKMALQGGFKLDNNGTVPEYFPAVGSRFGVNFKDVNPRSASMVNALQDNKPVVLMGQNTNGGDVPYGKKSAHYVLATGIDNKGNVSVLDPENKSNNSKKYNINQLADNTAVAMVAGNSKNKPDKFDKLAAQVGQNKKAKMIGGSGLASDAMGSWTSAFTGGGLVENAFGGFNVNKFLSGFSKFLGVSSDDSTDDSSGSSANGSGAVTNGSGLSKDMSMSEFVKLIYPLAQQGWEKYKVLPSITLAQAIEESAGGTSYLARTDSNLFGIKYPGNHDPALTISQGSWATDDGGYYTHYNSVQDSVDDHGYFLANNSNYKNLIGDTNYEDVAQKLHEDGYATEGDYAQNILSTIKQYGLDSADRGQMPPLASGAGGRGNDDIKTTIDKLYSGKSYNNKFKRKSGRGDSSTDSSIRIRPKGPKEFVGRALDAINNRDLNNQLGVVESTFNQTTGNQDDQMTKMFQAMLGFMQQLVKSSATVADNTSKLVGNSGGQQNGGSTVINNNNSSVSPTVGDDRNTLLNGFGPNNTKFSLIDAITSGH